MSSRVYYYAPLILMVFMLVYPMGALGVSIAKTLRKKKNPSLSIFGTTLFLIGLVGWYLLMGYTCFDLCIMLHRGLFNKILSFILAPIVAYLLIEAVPVYFRQEKEVLDGTFNPQQD